MAKDTARAVALLSTGSWLLDFESLPFPTSIK